MSSTTLKPNLIKMCFCCVIEWRSVLLALLLLAIAVGAVVAAPVAGTSITNGADAFYFDSAQQAGGSDTVTVSVPEQ